MKLDLKKFILVVMYIFLTIAGLVLMKIGGNTGNIKLEKDCFIFSMSFLSLFGFICYIASFLIFTNIVVKFKLSYIMPITAGLIQVLTLLSGYIVFKENVTINGIIGVILVILGIVVMNIKSSKCKN